MTESSSDDFPCVSCDRPDGWHAPGCPVAVRLCAESARRSQSDGWRSTCRLEAAKWAALVGVNSPLDLHWRAAADEPDDPVTPGEWDIAWDGESGMFIERDWDEILSVDGRRYLDQQAGRTPAATPRAR